MRHLAILLLLVFVAPASADIQLVPPDPGVGESILFSTTTTGNVSWDLGDGTTEQGRSASHAYAYPGIYRVQVLVSGHVVEQVEVEIAIPDDAYIDHHEIPPDTRRPGNQSHDERVPGRGFGDWAVEHPFVLMGIAALLASTGGFAYYRFQKRSEEELYDYDEEPEDESEEVVPDWRELLDDVHDQESGDEEIDSVELPAPVAEPPSSLDLDEPVPPRPKAPVVDEEDLRRRLEE